MDYLTAVYSREEKPKTKYPRLLAEYLFGSFIKSTDKSLLETGCGRGDMLEEFRKIGLKVQGTDLLKSAGLEYEKLEIVRNNIELEKLPFEDSSFDVIFSKSFVEHLYKPDIFFNEAMRVLKKNGILITLTPDWEVQVKKFYDDWTHKTPFTKVTLSNLYRVSGFSNIKVKYFKQLPILWKSKFYIMLLISYLLLLMKEKI